MKYSAVIAAAGLSSRMHEFKPMMCLGDETVIGSVIGGLRQAGVGEIVVVTGYRAEILAKHLEPMDVRISENRDYAGTKMFDSVVLGLAALREPYDAVFVTPGDVPLVKPDTIRLMMASGASLARPVYGGSNGHPVMISAGRVADIMKYDGSGGLRGAMDAAGTSIFDVAVDDVGVIMDADTPEDIRALRRRKMENRGGGGLWPDVRVNIGRADAILTPETAQFLEMIDHTGSIQSACACVHMSYSKGWNLLNGMEEELGYPLAERANGGAGGGGSTLTAAGRSLLAVYQEYGEAVKKESERLFNEMFAGDMRR